MNQECGTKLVSEVDGVLIYETVSGIKGVCYYTPTEPMRLKFEQLEVTLNSRGSSNHTKSKYPIEFELSLYGKATLPGRQVFSVIGEPDTKSNEVLISFSEEDPEIGRKKRDAWREEDSKTPILPGKFIGRLPYPDGAYLKYVGSLDGIDGPKNTWHLHILVTPSILRTLISRVDAKTITIGNIGFKFHKIYIDQDNRDWMESQSDSMVWLIKIGDCASGEMTDIGLSHIWTDDGSRS